MGEQYEIRVEGPIETSWSSWFEALAICPEPDGNTLLAGALEDQSALHGVLMKIRDLGLTLISVNRIEVKKEKVEG